MFKFVLNNNMETQRANWAGLSVFGKICRWLLMFVISFFILIMIPLIRDEGRLETPRLATLFIFVDTLCGRSTTQTNLMFVAMRMARRGLC